MRTFGILILLAALAFFATQYFTNPSSESQNRSEGGFERDGFARDGAGTSAAIATEGQPPAPVVSEPGEEDRLRDRIEDGGPKAARDQYRLATLLLARGDDAAADEAFELLEGLRNGKSEYAPHATTELFRNSSGEARLEYATYLVEDHGENAPGFASALAEIARSKMRRKGETAKVEAWRELSKAYFLSEDSLLRDAIRPDLDELAQTILWSPRRTPASKSYTIQSGDSLARIAKEHNSTVELLMDINDLESTTIHPGQSLKIVGGTFSIRVSKSEFRLDVLLDGVYAFSRPVGLGRDNRTPVGDFVIETKQEHPSWHKRGQAPIPYGHPDNPLGDRWMGFRNTEAHSGYGIHGTDEPETIGTESSAGCIRLRNEDVIELFGIIPRGTKVTITE